MSVRIDDEAKTISLSVRDLAADETLSGSISAEAMPAARAALGREAHAAHQEACAAADATYQGEYTLRHTFPFEEWTVTVQGRLDGLYVSSDTYVVEEVKSVHSIERALEQLGAGAYRSWTLQLRIYTLFLARESGRATDGYLVLAEVRGGATERVPVDLNEDELEAAIAARLRAIIAEHEERREWRERLATLSTEVPVSYTHLRAHET